MTQMTVPQAFEQAVRLHEAGQLREAESIYRQILRADPNHAMSLQNLGIIAHSARHPDAEKLLRQALALQPDQPNGYCNLAQVLMDYRRHTDALELMTQAVARFPQSGQVQNTLGLAHANLGRMDQAKQCFNRARQLSPDNLDVCNNCANIMAHQGDLQGAIALHREILSRQPNHVDAKINLARELMSIEPTREAAQLLREVMQVRANAQASELLAICLLQLLEFDEAFVWYAKALSLAPNDIELMNRLANALVDHGRYSAASEVLNRALKMDPINVPALCNMGYLLRVVGKPEEALIHLEKAVTLNPNFPPAWDNRASAYRAVGRVNEAVEGYKKAIELDPSYFPSHSNLGVTLHDRGDIELAAECFRKAMELGPSRGTMHYNLALTLLLLGQYEEGWREHEWRWRSTGFPSPIRHFTQPQWDGSDAKGKTILVHAEQGFGDTFNFVRYLPQVVARGAKVIFDCQEEVVRLLNSNKQLGYEQVLPRLVSALPPFDYHIPLLSLPLALRLYSPDEAPKTNPYLFADPELVELWRAKLAEDKSQLRIGITWAGRPTHGYDHLRSMKLDQFAAFALPGVRFYSLQFGDAAAQLKTASPEMNIVDPTSEIKDFSDTAAMIANLDLIIACDTAVVHLAGAMGKPAWVLVQRIPDFRWGRSGERTVWYPKVRLFRQSAVADWTDPIARAIDALKQVMAGNDPEVPLRNATEAAHA